MAGGMRRRGDRPSLAERIHGDAPPSGPSAQASASPVKPCWVTDRQGRNPGLLLEWRQVAAGWQGRVVRPVLDESGWIVVEEWLPAELLAP
ncbi:MAG: hypothetical protein QOH37_3030 [Nocardioidaceae bacterium]|nr:hypothetical protein [Nocardioidaceae bacterium]